MAHLHWFIARQLGSNKRAFKKLMVSFWVHVPIGRIKKLRHNIGSGFLNKVDEKWAKLKRCHLATTPAKRHKLLLEWSRRKFKRDWRIKDETVRATFDKHKRRKMGMCFVCDTRRARHRHHIVTVRNGGYNLGCNIVFLCPLCHEDIHPWMRQKRLTNAEQNDIDQMNAHLRSILP